jgi:hypothetical protein
MAIPMTSKKAVKPTYRHFVYFVNGYLINEIGFRLPRVKSFANIWDSSFSNIDSDYCIGFIIKYGVINDLIEFSSARISGKIFQLCA